MFEFIIVFLLDSTCIKLSLSPSIGIEAPRDVGFFNASRQQRDQGRRLLQRHARVETKNEADQTAASLALQTPASSRGFSWLIRMRWSYFENVVQQ